MILPIFDRRLSEWVLALGIDRNDVLQHLIFAKFIIERSHFFYSRFSLGDGAGLVNDKRIHLVHLFDSLGVFDEDSILGTFAHTDHHGHRGG